MTLYDERNEEIRKAFNQILLKKDPMSLIYIDECGFDGAIYRDYGYSPKGCRLMENISGKRLARISIIAGFCQNSCIAPMYFKGYCDTEVVVAWVKKELLPRLKAGQTVIWDNASFHKSPRLKELIEGAGCELLFLPPYSPDLNPIEQFWSWLKAWIRRLNLPHLHITQKIEKVFTKLET